MKRLVWIGVSLLVLAAAGTALVFRPRSPSIFPPVPQLNGYDDFLAAGRSFLPNSGDVRTQSVEQLRAHVANNTNVLALLRDGLRKESVVIMNFDPASPTFIGDLANFKGMASLLIAEGQIAEAEGRTNDVASSVADAFRFATRIKSGGLVIHEMIAVAIERICVNAIQRGLPGMGIAGLTNLAAVLKEAENQQEPIDRLFARDREWSRQAYGPWKTTVTLFATRKQQQKTEASVTKNRNASTAQRRQLRLDIAARLFELDHGTNAISAAQLVPKYIEAVPVDPTSGLPLTIRRTGNNL